MTSSMTPKSHAKKACDYCKQRHIKCDGKMPCHQCERRGRSCEYSFKSEKRGPKRKLIANGAPDNFSLPEEEEIPEKKTKRENKKKEEEKLTITKLQPDNSWAHVYQRSVAPFSSSEHGSFSSYQIQRILQIDNEKLKNASIDSLTDALEQLTIVSHGSRYCYHFEVSQKCFDRAFDIVDILHQKKAFTIKKYAQKLASNMELMNYYCVGSGNYYQSRILTNNSHHILSNYLSFLQPATAHRICALLIAKTTDVAEIDFWLKKAQSIKMNSMSFAEVSSWVVMSLNLAHPIVAFGGTSGILPECNVQLSQREFEHKIKALQIIDESEKAVDFCERLLPTDDTYSNGVCRVYRQVLYGSRALLLCQCKFYNPALMNAAEVIESENPDMCILPYSTSLAFACQVVKHFGKTDLLMRGLSKLDELSYQYTGLQNIVALLKENTSFSGKISEVFSESSSQSNDGILDSVSEKQQETSSSSDLKADLEPTPPNALLDYSEDQFPPFIADDCVFSEKDPFYQTDFFVNL